MFYKIPCGLALWPRGGIGRLRLLPKAGDAKAALPRKSDGDGAPSLPWEERARCRADLVRQHLVKKGRDAAPSGSQVSGNGVAVSWMQRRRCRASRTATARHPYRGRNGRAAARIWCGSTS